MTSLHDNLVRETAGQIYIHSVHQKLLLQWFGTLDLTVGHDDLDGETAL